ncbi:Choline transporter-like protein 2 [Intoshia linei]|uniref:Choline transporter-like protein n=1 Tax=Intoshia linei TaxID=1819745 RepID=A0A177B258_9BILA|nr:Choline transporter-like protein 2 [Intoshia linei]
MKAVDDVRSVWWLLLAMLVLAALVSFIWIVIMRWISGIMVWVSLISFTIVFAFATYYCFNEYVILLNKVATPAFSVGTDYKAYANYKETWLVAGIICAIFLIIMLILVIFLRNRIKIAVSIIKETSRYIQTMGSPQFTESPLQVTTDASLKLTETVGSLTAAVPCDPTGSSTSGKLCNFLKYGGDEYIYILQIYQLFMFLWVLNFIIAFGQMTLAGAFSGYYWAFNKPKDIPTFPLLGSAWRAFRYHIGTMAFGALIIAIIQMIRIFLEYLDQKLKSLTNPVARFIMCCLKCCFWCLEKFMKFINKNAYIMCAIYGKNFCVSAKNAFFLIIRNILRVVVVDKVTDFVLFISKIVVTAGMTTLAYFLFNGQLFDLNLLIAGIFLNYFFIPVIIVAIGTFIVASLFFSVYSMGVDTLFLCFLEDLERHDGSTEKPYYMSVELMDIVGKKNKPEKKK